MSLQAMVMFVYIFFSVSVPTSLLLIISFLTIKSFFNAGALQLSGYIWCVGFSHRQF